MLVPAMRVRRSARPGLSGAVLGSQASWAALDIVKCCLSYSNYLAIFTGSRVKSVNGVKIIS